MKKRTRHLLIGTTAVVTVAAGTLAANADWTIPGTVQVKIHNAKMPKGTWASVEAAL